MGDHIATICIAIFLFGIFPAIIIFLALRERRRTAAIDNVTKLEEHATKKCPKCGSDLVRAYVESGGLKDWCPTCNSSMEKNRVSKKSQYYLVPIGSLILIAVAIRILPELGLGQLSPIIIVVAIALGIHQILRQKK